MPRKRMINPDIWVDEGFVELSAPAKLLFISLISHADDHGKGPASIRTLKANTFPADDYSLDQIQDMRKELQEKLNVVFYLVDGREYYKLTKWNNHQYVQSSKASIIPEPEANNAINVSSTYEHVNGNVKPTEQHVAPTNKEKKRNSKKDNEYMQPPAAPNDTDRSVYHIIEQAFLSKNQDFAYGREGAHIVELEKKALARGNPIAFIKKVITVFWQLTHSDDKLFKDQPFLPSILNSSGLWPRVMKKIEQMDEYNEQLDPELERFIDNLFLEQA